MTERFVRTVLGPFRLEEDKGALTALEPVDRLPEGQSFGGASTDLLLAAEKALCAYLAGGPSDVDSLPLLLPEAPFARKVLEAMRAIPRGETRTYAEVARLVGHEGAARAVGSVCAKNRLLFVLPCHRIVPTTGVGHYRLGSDVKRRLLAMEKGDADAFRPKTVFVTSDEARAHLVRLGANWARLVEATGPLSRPIIPDLFEGLVRSFTSQQISVKAAAAIMGRLRQNCGPLTPEHLLCVDLELLRAQGLSANKAKWIHRAAERFAAGEFESGLLLRLEDEKIVEKLVTLDGVGRWTAEMIALFTLGRDDVLSLGDLGIRRGFERLYGRPLTKAEMERLRRRASPFGSAASLYLWHLASGGGVAD